jgi:hypothetical protein
MMSHKELEKRQDFCLFHEALGLIATGLEMKQSQRRWCSRLRKDLQRLIGSNYTKMELVKRKDWPKDKFVKLRELDWPKEMSAASRIDELGLT